MTDLASLITTYGWPAVVVVVVVYVLLRSEISIRYPGRNPTKGRDD
jgi:hypothetical protein